MRKALKLFGEAGIAEIELAICENPVVGTVIPGSGGLRKMRWRASGRGKSGGSRIIYYFADSRGRIFLLDLYVKKDKTDLKREDIAALSNLVTKWLQTK